MKKIFSLGGLRNPSERLHWNTDPVKAIQTSPTTGLKKPVYELLTAQQRLLQGVLA